MCVCVCVCVCVLVVFVFVCVWMSTHVCMDTWLFVSSLFTLGLCRERVRGAEGRLVTHLLLSKPNRRNWNVWGGVEREGERERVTERMRARKTENEREREREGGRQLLYLFYSSYSTCRNLLLGFPQSLQVSLFRVRE